MMPEPEDPLLDRVVARALDAMYGVLDPLEEWLARRAAKRLLATTEKPIRFKDCSAWEVLHMQSGAAFTTHYAMDLLALEDRGRAEAWLLVNGYEPLGGDTWKKTGVEP